MWTEVTKDLVIKEAIEQMGYDYEETEFFFYVMEYLKYVSFFPHTYFSSFSANASFTGGCTSTRRDF